MRLAMIVATPLAALALTPALADKPAVEGVDMPTVNKEESTDKSADEDKRVCRYIRTDPSSRRKSKVCMTADQWRKANQQR